MWTIRWKDIRQNKYGFGWMWNENKMYVRSTLIGICCYCHLRLIHNAAKHNETSKLIFFSVDIWKLFGPFIIHTAACETTLNILKPFTEMLIHNLLVRLLPFLPFLHSLPESTRSFDSIPFRWFWTEIFICNEVKTNKNIIVESFSMHERG